MKRYVEAIRQTHKEENVTGSLRLVPSLCPSSSTALPPCLSLSGFYPSTSWGPSLTIHACSICSVLCHLNSLPTALLIHTLFIYLSRTSQYYNHVFIHILIWYVSLPLNCKLHENKESIYVVLVYSKEVNLFCKIVLNSITLWWVQTFKGSIVSIEVFRVLCVNDGRNSRGVTDRWVHGPSPSWACISWHYFLSCSNMCVPTTHTFFFFLQWLVKLFLDFP